MESSFKPSIQVRAAVRREKNMAARMNRASSEITVTLDEWKRWETPRLENKRATTQVLLTETTRLKDGEAAQPNA
jgi:alpha-L-arabinofuranosidase